MTRNAHSAEIDTYLHAPFLWVRAQGERVALCAIDVGWQAHPGQFVDRESADHVGAPGLAGSHVVCNLACPGAPDRPALGGCLGSGLLGTALAALGGKGSA